MVIGHAQWPRHRHTMGHGQCQCPIPHLILDTTEDKSIFLTPDGNRFPIVVMDNTILAESANSGVRTNSGHSWLHRPDFHNVFDWLVWVAVIVVWHVFNRLQRTPVALSCSPAHLFDYRTLIPNKFSGSEKDFQSEEIPERDTCFTETM